MADYADDHTNRMIIRYSVDGTMFQTKLRTEKELEADLDAMLTRWVQSTLLLKLMAESTDSVSSFNVVMAKYALKGSKIYMPLTQLTVQDTIAATGTYYPSFKASLISAVGTTLEGNTFKIGWRGFRNDASRQASLQDWRWTAGEKPDVFPEWYADFTDFVNQYLVAIDGLVPRIYSYVNVSLNRYIINRMRRG